MKKNLLILIAIVPSFFASAQELRQNPTPQITVSGEGKVRVTPDQALIVVGFENKGTNATEVKKQNDAQVEKVVQAIRKSGLAKEDVMTKRVTLNPIYDYEKKKQHFHAVQTIEILVRNLSQYDAIMQNLVDAGINRINSVEFKSSKMAIHESEARKLAMQQAKLKASDYVGVLGQTVGKALMISDNTQAYYPQPMYEMAMAKSDDSGMPRETLALGEINITANVSVSFLLQ